MTLDFDTQRQHMVDGQVRTSDVTNLAVLSAFLEVPREAFVATAHLPLAYLDHDLEIAPGRAVMAPAKLAKLVQAASVCDDDIVLDIGCGTGYSTAILSRLCNSVVAVEENPALADTASSKLGELGFDNAAVIQSPLALGCKAEGPFDVIFVGGSVDAVPSMILDQLKDGGRLVAVEGQGNAGVARLWTRDGSSISSRRLFNCAVAALPGFARAPEFQF
ncbi:MAG: protein-L-isoaspartate O-methyltransferase [Nitratireductor sp.]|nr:protein-L-isoaspartate O-methyltransferase [Nitratireductor sp.]